jgi:hypothetical protein
MKMLFLELKEWMPMCFQCRQRFTLIIPWQQLINLIDRMIYEAAEGVGEPCLRIDTVELGGFNQGIDDGRGFTAAF